MSWLIQDEITELNMPTHTEAAIDVGSLSNSNIIVLHNADEMTVSDEQKMGFLMNISK